MKIKLLPLLIFFCGAAQSPITQAEVFSVGTKFLVLPNQCGNSVPEADGKLTFCDGENNLLIVDESNGLNARGVEKMLPNYANQDEVYVTTTGISIRNENGSWDNIPNMAIPTFNSSGIWTNNAIIRNGLVLPDGSVLITSSNANGVMYRYDRSMQTMTDIPFPPNRFPFLLTYDAVNDITWIIASQGGNSAFFLFSYDGATLTQVDDVSEIVEGVQSNANIPSVILYKDATIYLGSPNGLHKIDVSDTTSVPLTITTYNSGTTPSLPIDIVNDFQFGPNGNLWLAQGLSSTGGIVKFNIEDETLDNYELASESNPAIFISFTNVAIDENGLVWATASNSSALINLELIEGEPTWTTVSLAELEALGVPATYGPSSLNFRNDKFYFTIIDGSSAVNTNYEVIINDDDVWTGRSDDAPGNISNLGNSRFSINLPDDIGGMWWFNSSDDVILHRSANEELFIRSGARNLQNYAAIDFDQKPITTFSAGPGQGNKLRKVDTPVDFEIIETSIDQSVRDLFRHKDQVWWFQSSKLNILRYNELFATFDLDPSYSNVFEMSVDSNGNAWFMKNLSTGNLQLKRFDPLTEVTTDFDFPFSGTVRKCAPGPNGVMWFAGAFGIVYWDGSEFTSYLTADFDEFYNIRSIAVDENNIAYILQNDGALITKLEGVGNDTPTLTNIDLEGSNSILPSFGHYRPSDISIDNQGYSTFVKYNYRWNGCRCYSKKRTGTSKWSHVGNQDHWDILITSYRNLSDQ
ncbi:MAG: hypothetical protein HRU26_12305 [Psychroserpens sp.]|nr:hypothetical protein [Psychroserpens sp.]